jgi:hypothetical protein
MLGPSGSRAKEDEEMVEKKVSDFLRKRPWIRAAYNIGERVGVLGSRFRGIVVRRTESAYEMATYGVSADAGLAEGLPPIEHTFPEGQLYRRARRAKRR